MKYTAVNTQEQFTGLETTVAQSSKKVHKWKHNVYQGFAAAVLVFGVNLALLFWTRARSRDTNSNGIVIVYSGNCTKARNIALWSHLAINVLSSILLAAGNVCMQCLVAPTRNEIDEAHSKRSWLDIGVNTVRNIKGISASRKLLWALLALSTVPLHLLYNSVVFEAKVVNDFAVAAVSQSFVDGGPWDPTRAGCFSSSHNFVPALTYMQQDSKNFVQLNNSDCISKYAPQFITDWANLLLVTSDPPYSNETLLHVFRVQCEDVTPSDWICNGPHGGSKFCESPQSVADPASWVALGSANASVDYRYSDGLCSMDASTTYRIKYCLAQPTPEACQIGVSPTILLIVLLCNLIKIFCFLWTTWRLDYEPLVTLGDAIASFLERPDPSTRGCGPISADLKGWIAGNGRPSGVTWKAQRLTGFSAATWKRWLVCNLLFILVWIVGLVLLLSGSPELGANNTFAAYVAAGIGQLNVSLMVTLGGMPKTIMGNVVIANTPQLLISLLYLLYNDLFTRMHIAMQWSSYAHKRKMLRLLAPPTKSIAAYGGFRLRSQYILSLPLRISLPLLVVMMVLHWLISQSIFLAVLGVQDYTSGGTAPTDKGYPVLGLGWSPFAIVLSLLVGGLMIVGLWVNASMIQLGRTMPVVRTCSAAVSAACHPPDWDVNVAEKPVAYGAVQTAETGQNGEKRPGHACFTSGPVEALVDGELYS